MAADGSALFGLIERNENMETFCGWIDCYARCSLGSRRHKELFDHP
jgi:hypothetical protein